MTDQVRPSPRASFFAERVLNSNKILEFRSLVWKFYETSGRHELPWRKTHNPYRILVSEVMLQQTQVDRVIPFYQNFLKKFPTIRVLAMAPLSEVLIAWQGLGYNRRAKMLHLAAKEVVDNHKGKFPKSVEELELLPGIGPYTARAVAAFAYNQDVVFIETNLRTVITHHFFKDSEQVSDKEILEVIAHVFPTPTPTRGAREWYAALMDYGSYLKRSGVRINAKSKTYTKQSKFTGSDREARGAILKELAKGSQSKERLLGLLGDSRTVQLEKQIGKLIRESLIEKRGRLFSLPR
jgi:A/G-specific adenine glycosylase